MLYFENDYCEGAHEEILKKLVETNLEKTSGYGTDPYCASAGKIRAVLQLPGGGCVLCFGRDTGQRHRYCGDAAPVRRVVGCYRPYPRP